MIPIANSGSTWSQEHHQRPGWFTSHVFDPAVRRITRLGASVAGSRILKAHRRTTREPRRTPTPAGHRREQTSTALELLAKRAAWDRFRAAVNALDERRTAFVSSPDDLTAEQVRWAEVELEDAVAVAGEFQVYNLPWSLA